MRPRSSRPRGEIAFLQWWDELDPPLAPTSESNSTTRPPDAFGWLPTMIHGTSPRTKPRRARRNHGHCRRAARRSSSRIGPPLGRKRFYPDKHIRSLSFATSEVWTRACGRDPRIQERDEFLVRPSSGFEERAPRMERSGGATGGELEILGRVWSRDCGLAVRVNQSRSKNRTLLLGWARPVYFWHLPIPAWVTAMGMSSFQ